MLKKLELSICLFGYRRVRNLARFKNEFPNKILNFGNNYYDSFDYKEHYITEVNFDRENDKYLQGKEYLTKLALLSRTDCMVAGLCGESYFSYFMNQDHYEHTYFFELGLYGN